MSSLGVAELESRTKDPNFLGTVALAGASDLQDAIDSALRGKLPVFNGLVAFWIYGITTLYHYPITLRPKLNPRRFRADTERLQQADLLHQSAYWGGEPAAEKLTRYLKPAQFTIYAREPIAKLIAAGRMCADPTGNVEILDAFWNLTLRKSFQTSFPNPCLRAPSGDT